MSTQIWDGFTYAPSQREDSELAARTELAHAALRIWLLHMRQMRAPYERNMAKTRYWLQYRITRRPDRPWARDYHLPGGICPPGDHFPHYPQYWLLLAWATDADYGPIPNRICKGPGF